MQPVPQFELTPGATHLLKGDTLNALMAAIQARTPLNAAAAGSAGHMGATTGAAPKLAALHKSRFDPHKVYVAGPRFFARLAADLGRRLPAATGKSDALGFKAGTTGPGVKPPAKRDASAAGLAQILAPLRAATPASPVEASPRGYRQRAVPHESALLSYEWHSGSGSARFDILDADASQTYAHLQRVYTYENGSWQEDYSVDPDLVTWGGDDAELAAPTPDFTSTQDEEFDYGGYISEADTLLDPVTNTSGLGEDELYEAALAATQWSSALNSASGTANTRNWEPLAILSISHVNNAATGARVTVDRKKLRLKWGGVHAVNAQIRLGGTYPIFPYTFKRRRLPPGVWSDWIELPAEVSQLSNRWADFWSAIFIQPAP